jgi:hypothetical protein
VVRPGPGDGRRRRRIERGRPRGRGGHPRRRNVFVLPGRQDEPLRELRRAGLHPRRRGRPDGDRTGTLRPPTGGRRPSRGRRARRARGGRAAGPAGGRPRPRPPGARRRRRHRRASRRAPGPNVVPLHRHHGRTTCRAEGPGRGRRRRRVHRAHPAGADLRPRGRGGRQHDRRGDRRALGRTEWHGPAVGHRRSRQRRRSPRRRRGQPRHHHPRKLQLHRHGLGRDGLAPQRPQLPPPPADHAPLHAGRVRRGLRHARSHRWRPRGKILFDLRADA